MRGFFMRGEGPARYLAGGWRDMQIPSDAAWLDRLDTAKPKLVYATKITHIYLRKVQNVLSFLFWRGPLAAS